MYIRTELFCWMYFHIIFPSSDDYKQSFKFKIPSSIYDFLCMVSYIVNPFLLYKLTFLVLGCGFQSTVWYNTLVNALLSLPLLRNDWVKFWTNSIKHFWNNRPVRLPTLRFSYTLFLTVAILRFFKKGINFVITIAFCNDTAYTRVFWFDNWLVWRYSSWSAHKKTHGCCAKIYTST